MRPGPAPAQSVEEVSSGSDMPAWLAVATIVYVYVGFPLILFGRAIGFGPGAPRRSEEMPTVSYVIVAYNEVDVIARKLDNVLCVLCVA